VASGSGNVAVVSDWWLAQQQPLCHSSSQVGYIKQRQYAARMHLPPHNSSRGTAKSRRKKQNRATGGIPGGGCSLRLICRFHSSCHLCPLLSRLSSYSRDSPDYISSLSSSCSPAEPCVQGLMPLELMTLLGVMGRPKVVRVEGQTTTWVMTAFSPQE
jgi:hypothetical protein